MSGKPKDLVGRNKRRGFQAIISDWAMIIAITALSIYVDYWSFYLFAVSNDVPPRVR